MKLVLYLEATALAKARIEVAAGESGRRWDEEDERHYRKQDEPHWL